MISGYLTYLRSPTSMYTGPKSCCSNNIWSAVWVQAALQHVDSLILKRICLGPMWKKSPQEYTHLVVLQYKRRDACKRSLLNKVQFYLLRVPKSVQLLFTMFTEISLDQGLTFLNYFKLYNKTRHKRKIIESFHIP